MREVAVRSLLVVGALVTPPVLMLTIGITLGEGGNLLRALWDLPVVGAAVRALMGAIMWLYSLDLQVGAMTPLWVLNGLYLVFAALFARRRLWVPAAIVLIVPVVVSWYVASLLQD
jgi:hypothetical protein